MKILNYIGIFIPLIIFIYFAKSPIYNWDKLAYMACVLKLDGQDNVHKKVYSEASKLDFYVDTSYRKEMKVNEKAFDEQISFYHSRIAYTFTVWIFYKITNDLNIATYIPSVLFSLLSLLLLFHILNGIIKRISITTFLILLLLFLFRDIIQYTTPDAMSLFFLMLSTYFYWIKKNFYFLFLGIVAILVRPDNVLYIITLIIFGGILLKLNQKLLLFQIIVLAFIYWGIGVFYTSPSFGTLLYHTFIQKVYYPISSPPLFGIENYMEIILTKGKYSLDNLGMRIFLILIGFLMLKTINNPLRNMFLVIILSLFVTVISKFLLFPEILERHFIFYDITIVVVLTAIITHYFQKNFPKMLRISI